MTAVSLTKSILNNDQLNDSFKKVPLFGLQCVVVNIIMAYENRLR